MSFERYLLSAVLLGIVAPSPIAAQSYPQRPVGARRLIRAELRKWEQVIRTLGISAEFQ